MELKCEACGFVSTKEDVYGQFGDLIPNEGIQMRSELGLLRACCKECGEIAPHSVVED